ncbi:MAG: hypothetical protein IPL03_09195 [Sterolibacteriaceae bacterium]|nr:hypothetical protein [Candidatus Methylophosphatis haderslevensis]
MGKIVVVLGVAGLLAATVMDFGGMMPLVVGLVALVAYSVIARQRATLSGTAAQVNNARARVAAQASPYDLIRHD